MRKRTVFYSFRVPALTNSGIVFILRKMEVELHRDAEKYLDRLPEPWKSQIDDALDDLEKEPPEGDIRPYEGNPGIWRLKMGKYRVLFKVETDRIFVTHIEPRGQVYTKKTRQTRGKK